MGEQLHSASRRWFVVALPVQHVVGQVKHAECPVECSVAVSLYFVVEASYSVVGAVAEGLG